MNDGFPLFSNIESPKLALQNQLSPIQRRDEKALTESQRIRDNIRKLAGVRLSERRRAQSFEFAFDEPASQQSTLQHSNLQNKANKVDEVARFTSLRQKQLPNDTVPKQPQLTAAKPPTDVAGLITDLQQKNQNLQQQLDQQIAKFEVSEQQRHDLKSQNAELQRLLDEAQTRPQKELHQRVAEIQSKTTRDQANLRLAEEKRYEAEGRLKECERLLENETKLGDSLRITTAKQQKQIEDLIAKNNELLTQSQRKQDEQQQKIAQISAQLDTKLLINKQLEEKLRNVTAEQEALIEEATNISIQLDEAKTTISALHLQCKDRNDIQQKLVESQQNEYDMEQQVKLQKADGERQVSTILQLSQEKENQLIKDIENERLEVKELNRELKQANEQQQEMKEQIIELSKLLHNNRKNNTELKNKIEETTSDTQKLQVRITELETTLEKQNQLLSIIDPLKQQLEQSLLTIEDKDSQLEEQFRNIEALHEALEKKKEDLRGERIDDLNRKVTLMQSIIARHDDETQNSLTMNQVLLRTIDELKGELKLKEEQITAALRSQVKVVQIKQTEDKTESRNEKIFERKESDIDKKPRMDIQTARQRLDARKAARSSVENEAAEDDEQDKM